MEMSATQKVGQEIKKVRYRIGLTQKELGKLIGKSESQIGAYENASASITLDVLFKIAEVTKTKPEELITGPATKEVKTGWDAELRIYGLEDRKAVMTILAVNGYDVGQHKKQVTPTGKAVAYYVHATDRKWYMIIDDEDETVDQYHKNFGPEHVIMFDKQAAYDRADTMDNFNEHRAIIYARNETFRIAKELGLKYFLMLDDDYKEIDFRYVNGNKLSAKPARQMDRIFEDMLRFLDVSGAATVAFAQGGDFVGGLDGGNFKKGLLRKAMNSLFCRTDRPIDFRGTMNEDVTTYTTLGSRGRLFFTLCNMCVIQIPTQSLDGGMTESYLETGTYVKTFYSVMAMPSCIKVSMMYTKHKRIHHRIDWECCVPKIINEKYRKEVR